MFYLRLALFATFCITFTQQSKAQYEIRRFKNSCPVPPPCICQVRKKSRSFSPPENIDESSVKDSVPDAVHGIDQKDIEYSTTVAESTKPKKEQFTTKVPAKASGDIATTPEIKTISSVTKATQAPITTASIVKSTTAVPKVPSISPARPEVEQKSKESEASGDLQNADPKEPETQIPDKSTQNSSPQNEKAPDLTPELTNSSDKKETPDILKNLLKPSLINNSDDATSLGKKSNPQEDAVDQDTKSNPQTDEADQETNSNPQIDNADQDAKSKLQIDDADQDAKSNPQTDDADQDTNSNPLTDAANQDTKSNPQTDDADHVPKPISKEAKSSDSIEDKTNISSKEKTSDLVDQDLNPDLNQDLNQDLISMEEASRRRRRFARDSNNRHWYTGPRRRRRRCPTPPPCVCPDDPEMNDVDY